jgi:hypothetical protein
VPQKLNEHACSHEEGARDLVAVSKQSQLSSSGECGVRLFYDKILGLVVGLLRPGQVEKVGLLRFRYMQILREGELIKKMRLISLVWGIR